jgi:hypothetical protein
LGTPTLSAKLILLGFLSKNFKEVLSPLIMLGFTSSNLPVLKLYLMLVFMK